MKAVSKRKTFKRDIVKRIYWDRRCAREIPQEARSILDYNNKKFAPDTINVASLKKTVTFNNGVDEIVF